MKRVLLAIVFVCVASVASAQTGSANNKLAWDQPAASIAEAQSLTYKLYADGAATASTLPTATCTGATAPYACSVPFPAFTPGSHTVQLSASNAAGESPKSAAFGFTFVVIPASPANIRVQ